ncbi:MAG TPA: hypothetical protein DCR97_00110 [Deltaproteobacteria bacterium]|nr:hypothetical protein [Deltaproteobacteria bacterium]
MIDEGQLDYVMHAPDVDPELCIWLSHDSYRPFRIVLKASEGRLAIGVLVHVPYRDRNRPGIKLPWRPGILKRVNKPPEFPD